MSIGLMERLPIVIFSHEFFPKKGGIAVFTQEMARTLNDLGFHVEVFVPSHPQLNATEFHYKIRPISCKGSQDWSCRLISGIELIRIRKQLQDSILYLPEPGPIRLLIYLRLLPIIKPKKLILTLHGSDINRLSAFPHRRILFARLINECHRVTVPSEYARQLLVGKFPIADTKLLVTPGALRANLNVHTKSSNKPYDMFTIITVARIHPRKGQNVMLEAIGALDSNIKRRISYRMIGPIIDQRYFNKLNDIIARHGINAEVSGEMNDDELAKMYQKADLFAMTSLPYRHSVEGFGLSYLEASANGIPILAHRTGGVEDAVRDGVNGLLTEPNDPAGLVAALRRLILDENLRKTLANGGRKWVQQFSWEKNARAAFS